MNEGEGAASGVTYHAILEGRMFAVMDRVRLPTQIPRGQRASPRGQRAAPTSENGNVPV